MNIKHFIEKKVPRNRVLLLIILDVLILSLSGFLALYIRYDFKFGNMAMRFAHSEMKALPINVLIALTFFVLFKLYRSVWHFASATELLNVLLACLCSAGVQVLWMSIVKWR